MDNKLSELSKPVAWKIHGHDYYYLEMREEEVFAAARIGRKSESVYSQEYVSALLADRDAFEGAALALRDELREVRAELEAKDHAHRVHAARLIDERGALRERAEAAEKQLATPVRLPEGLAQKIKVIGYYKALNEMMDCVRAAGFKCVGDE